MKIKRRDFLKLSAATGAAVALSQGTSLNALAAVPRGVIGGEQPGLVAARAAADFHDGVAVVERRTARPLGGHHLPGLHHLVSG